MEISPELEIIAMIREMLPGAADGVIRGIGDDCAILAPPSAPLLVSSDTLVQGTHFDLGWHPPRDLGYKSAAVNLSDIAAMGGRPLYFFLSLGLPEADLSFCREFMRGFAACLGKHGGALVGGDTVRSPVYAFTVTVIGEAVGEGAIKRSTAAAGDEILISGFSGAAAAGLELCRQGAGMSGFPELVKAHLAPEPRISLGMMLARSGLVRSMIDLSDGIVSDLGHICRESALGAEISADQLPLAPSMAAAAAATGHDPQALALNGGEDYELLFTVAPADVDGVMAEAAAAGHVLHRVGRMVKGEGVWLIDGGERRGISAGGFEHFSG